MQYLKRKNAHIVPLIRALYHEECLIEIYQIAKLGLKCLRQGDTVWRSSLPKLCGVHS